MAIAIISKSYITGSDGSSKGVLLQFAGKELNAIDYLSGTVKLGVEATELTDIDLEKEVLKEIQKGLYPEPFNDGKLADVSDKVNRMNEEITAIKTGSKEEQTSTIQMFSMFSMQLEKVASMLLREDISEEDYADFIKLYDEWSPNAIFYPKGKFVRHNNIVYEVITENTSQQRWEPGIEETRALFKEVIPPSVVGEDGEEVEIIGDWSERDGSNGYANGVKKRFEGEIYESLKDNNVYSPTDVPSDWKVVPE